MQSNEYVADIICLLQQTTSFFNTVFSTCFQTDLRKVVTLDCRKSYDYSAMSLYCNEYMQRRYATFYSLKYKLLHANDVKDLVSYLIT